MVMLVTMVVSDGVTEVARAAELELGAPSTTWGRPQQSLNLLPSQRQGSKMCKLQQAVGQSAETK